MENMGRETTRVSLRISPKRNEWLENRCKETGLTKSALLNMALENYQAQVIMSENIDLMREIEQALIRSDRRIADLEAKINNA